MDKYDKAIEYLERHPDEIHDTWSEACEARGIYDDDDPSNLFQIADRPGVKGSICGCLTQVRNYAPAATPELTAAIRADQRIPKDGEDVTVAHLPMFAEWQRAIDKYFETGVLEPPIKGPTNGANCSTG